MENKILHLTLKKKWFDMIASGVKKEEYREVKDYWVRRLFYTSLRDFKYYNYVFINGWWMGPLPYTHILFKNGYGKNAPSMLVECKGIEKSEAKPEWSDNWQGEVFVIKLGDIVKAGQ